MPISGTHPKFIDLKYLIFPPKITKRDRISSPREFRSRDAIALLMNWFIESAIAVIGTGCKHCTPTVK
ncbi:MULTISPECIES: hypothetical protein [Spirulina sp. CCY15215]|uniref:hypothetical protein n=1 Tax=Spirulina sp. CCY15215 TaxID=2767591 RepID=UPI00194E964C|nr:hypothetical protein [Spirulina major]